MAFELSPAGIVTQMPQDNFKSIIGEIKALDILVCRRFKSPTPVGHPGLDMSQAVILNRCANNVFEPLRAA
jgi:hypothetical protein